MKTIIIAINVTLTATESTIVAYERELREEAAERELREYLAVHKSGDPDYSDIYKDIYGVRPRW